MQQPKFLFRNFLDDKEIIDVRLYAFLLALISYLNSQNTGGVYDALIALLTPATNALGNEISDVDLDAAGLKGLTYTNDQVVEMFGQTMKDKEGVIADALGGFTSEGYMLFYPNGFAEYTQANKTKMPVLVKRVWEATEQYKSDLSPALVTKLSAFKDQWTLSREKQELKKGSLGGNREQRDIARKAAELAGVVAVHTIGAKFPGDAEMCLSFFDFSLLYPQSHKKAEVLQNTLEPGETEAASNKTYSEDAKFYVKNEAENADLEIGFAATADSMPEKTEKVNAAQGHHFTFNNLGGGDNKPFLIVKNLSGVNPVKYVVEVK